MMFFSGVGCCRPVGCIVEGVFEGYCRKLKGIVGSCRVFQGVVGCCGVLQMVVGCCRVF